MAEHDTPAASETPEAPTTGKGVSLRELVGDLEMVFDGWNVSVNPQTGEVATWGDPGVIDGFEDEEVAQYDAEPWLWVEPPDEDHDWRVMRDFAVTRSSESVQVQLLRALNGRRPFASFRGQLRGLGLEDDWHPFQRAALAERIRAWLEMHDVPFVDDEQDD